MKNKVIPFVENIAESGAACLVTMVQGNILALGLSHWLIASQTGLLAGTAAATAMTVARTSNRWIIAGVLGIATGVVDYFVHPGMIGSAPTEAVSTGCGAALLSRTTGAVVSAYRARKSATA